jgi:hypothetical protein
MFEPLAARFQPIEVLPTLRAELQRLAIFRDQQDSVRRIAIFHHAAQRLGRGGRIFGDEASHCRLNVQSVLEASSDQQMIGGLAASLRRFDPLYVLHGAVLATDALVQEHLDQPGKVICVRRQTAGIPLAAGDLLVDSPGDPGIDMAGH